MSGAVSRVVERDDADSSAADDRAGAWVAVRTASGEIVGHGHYSPHSTIRVRLLDFGPEDPGESLLGTRIEAAVRAREQNPVLRDCDALRLVNAEGDGLPGLVVDRYADVVVVRPSTVGMHRRMEAIVEALRKATSASIGIERGDGHAARREGYAQRDGVLWGAPVDSVSIEEHGRRYLVDVLGGQKTGFYLDQRDARDRVEALAAGCRLLDVFAYTGGFAVAAARGGARSVTLLDSSAPALEWAERNLALSGSTCPVELRRGDAFEGLRAAASNDERYELIVLDPPPLARRKSDVDAASRAYKDLVLHAIACATPGARLLVFSCSHHVGAEQLTRIAASAAVDARCDLLIEGHHGAPADHPVSVHHPEGTYLCGLLLRVGEPGRGGRPR